MQENTISRVKPHATDQQGGIWITWESQRRNKGLSGACNYKLYEIIYKGSRWIRYLYSAWKTFHIIRSQRPEVVVAQNPSILLATQTVFLKRLFRFKAVIDAHNSGIYPAEGRHRPLLKWSKWLQRNADLTLVTNEQLKRHVEKNGGNGFVLQDMIPSAGTEYRTIEMRGRFNILFICTFAEDEPYDAVFQAAKLLPEDTVIHVTGNYAKKVSPSGLPGNIELLGFVDDETYWSCLFSADCIMDLTVRENCLVCGAYEGVAAGKPLLLSQTDALQKFFYKGCVWIDNSPEGIAEAIRSAIKNHAQLTAEILELQRELLDHGRNRVQRLMEKIEALRQE